MRIAALSILMLGGLLSGCEQDGTVSGPGAKGSGRFAGVGTYEAGRLWRELAGVAAPSDPAAATLADDERIIVVVDTRTGEIRRCGDYSGVCVTTNPWAAPGSRAATPVKLKKHAADIEAEDKAGVAEEASRTAETTP